jgi:hypothetical protein
MSCVAQLISEVEDAGECLFPQQVVDATMILENLTKERERAFRATRRGKEKKRVKGATLKCGGVSNTRGDHPSLRRKCYPITHFRVCSWSVNAKHDVGKI